MKQTTIYRLMGWGIMFLSLFLLTPIAIIIFELADIIENQEGK